MPYLIQKNSDGTVVQQWELKDKPMVFGRGQEADIKVDDREMSRRHFLIEHSQGHYVIRDLDSSNGTWVNVNRIAEGELRPGDRIRAGQTTFVFEKGLGTIIGELAKDQKGFRTQMKEISNEASS